MVQVGFKVLLKIAWSSRVHKSLVEGITYYFVSKFFSIDLKPRLFLCQEFCARTYTILTGKRKSSTIPFQQPKKLHIW